MATSTIALCSSLTSHCKISHRHNQNPPSLSLLSLSKASLSLSKPKFCSPLLSTRPAFPHIPKVSESEGAVIDVELDKAEPAQIVETTTKEEAKRDDLFAVIMVGSRQYIVFPGRWIYVQRLKGAKVNDKAELKESFVKCALRRLYVSFRNKGSKEHVKTSALQEIFNGEVNNELFLLVLLSIKTNDIFKKRKIVLHKVLLVGTDTTTYIGKPVVTNAAVHAIVEEQGLNPKVIVFKYKKKKNYRRNIGHRQPNTRIRITAITGYQDYPAVTLDSLGKTSNTEGSS